LGYIVQTRKETAENIELFVTFYVNFNFIFL